MFQQFITDNWLAILVVVIALAILFVLLWRNYDIEEITPAPPFIKFKRKAKPAPTPTIAPSQSASVNISGNILAGKNKVAVQRDNVNVSGNKLLGENEIEVSEEKKKGKK